MFEARRPFGWLFLFLPILAALAVSGQTLPTTLIVEGLFSHRSGTEKKDAALSFLEAALSVSNAIANREIVDREKFKDGLGKVIDGAVECLNASVWAKASSQEQRCAFNPPLSR